MKKPITLISSIILILSLILFILGNKQKKPIDIKNTKWIYDYGIEDVIIFKEITYVNFSAELQEYDYGEYIVSGDIVTLYEKRGESDSESKTKLVFKNKDQLGYLLGWNEKEKKWRNNHYFIKQGNITDSDN